MAFKIPETATARPSQQGAFQMASPEQTFGNQIASISGQPNVPDALGGAVIRNEHYDTSAGRGLFAIAETLGEVAYDLDKKEKALIKGEDTYRLRENSIRAENEAHAAQQRVLARQAAENLSIDDTHVLYNEELGAISEKYHGTEGYRDREVAQAAKLEGLAYRQKMSIDFTEKVVVPQRVANIKASVKNAVVNQTQSIANNPTPENLAQGYSVMENIYNDPITAITLTPAAREAALYEGNREMTSAFVNGRFQAALKETDPNTKIAIYSETQQTLMTLSEQGKLKGVNGDDLARYNIQLEERKEAVRNDTERRAARAEREAERAEKLAEKQAVNDINQAIETDPHKVSRESISANKLLSFDHKIKLNEKLDRALVEGESKLQRVEKVLANVAAGQSYAMAKGQDVEDLDNAFKYEQKRLKSEGYTPAQMRNAAGAFIKQSQTIPKSLATDLSRKMVSTSNPAIQAEAIETVKAVETLFLDGDPTKQSIIVSALSDEARDVYMTMTRLGGSLEDVNKNLRSLRQTTETDQKLMNHRMQTEAKVRNEVEMRIHNDKDLQDRLNNDYKGWFKPEVGVPDYLKTQFDRAVVANYARVGNLKVAKEMAYQDVLKSNQFGVTEIGGKRVTKAAPEVVYKMPTEKIIANVVESVPPEYGINHTNFQLGVTPLSAERGEYLILKLNENTKLTEPIYPVGSNEPLMWKYSGYEKDRAESEAAKQAAMQAADKKRDLFIKQQQFNESQREAAKNLNREYNDRKQKAPTAQEMYGTGGKSAATGMSNKDVNNWQPLSQKKRVIDDPGWKGVSQNLEQQYGLNPGTLTAVLMQEGGGRADPGTSSKGAKGAFQFMPETAKQYGVDFNSVGSQARGAAQYLSDLQKEFGDHLMALAAYNYGPENVRQARRAAKAAGEGTDIASLVNNKRLPAETRNYVKSIDAKLS